MSNSTSPMLGIGITLLALAVKRRDKPYSITCSSVAVQWSHAAKHAAQPTGVHHGTDIKNAPSMF